jgi:hypothetical protein
MHSMHVMASGGITQSKRTVTIQAPRKHDATDTTQTIRMTMATNNTINTINTINTSTQSRTHHDIELGQIY